MKYAVLVLMVMITLGGLTAAPDTSELFDSGSAATNDSEPTIDEEQSTRSERARSETNRVQRTELVLIDSSASVKEVRPKDRQKQAQTPNYKVEIKSTGERRWAAVRYDANTGKSWRMMEGRWLPIKELRQLRPKKRSEFIVKIDHTATSRFCALRMDVNSGQCWALEEDTWTPILEEQE